MSEPRWWSQKFRPEGGAASDGIRRQLGTPSLDPLTVLVRETAQNSWDAREFGREQIRFSMELRTVRGPECAAWRRLLDPGVVADHFALATTLANEEFVLLTVSDRGTTGLGGPIRSGLVTEDQPDFVNFVRNVGERRDRDLGGGTYGFGKASLYGVSDSDTVLVSTRCLSDHTLQRRLIGTALGRSFNLDGHRYTGRHWWGLVADDDVPDPVLDARSEALCAQLGLPAFERADRGTDLVIVGAQLGVAASEDRGRTVTEAGEMIASSLAWYLWPKLVDWGSGPAMVCTVIAEGIEIPIPDPRTDPLLAPFVESLGTLRAERGAEFARSRPPRSAGRFAASVAIAPTNVGRVTAMAAPFSGPAHHCARMRHVELVVDYMPGPELPDSIAQYGAVFKATAVADEYFAVAEPPTHDAWVTRHLSGTALGVVRDSTTFVRQRMQALVPSAGKGAGDTPQAPLGGVSRRLARALPGGPGAGGSAPEPGGRPGRSSARRPFRVVSQPALRVVDGSPMVQMEIELALDAAGFDLVASAAVATDGGREAAAPVGGRGPVVGYWVSDQGAKVMSDRLKVTAAVARRWTVVARPAPDTATQLDVRIFNEGVRS